MRAINIAVINREPRAIHVSNAAIQSPKVRGPTVVGYVIPTRPASSFLQADPRTSAEVSGDTVFTYIPNPL